MVVEAEICGAACEALKKLGFNEFTIRINHRRVLFGILMAAGISTDKHEGALIAIDKLDKIGRDGVSREFNERGITVEAGEILLSFFVELSELEHAADLALDQSTSAKNEAINRAVLGRIVEFLARGEAGAEGVEELRLLLNYATSGELAAHIRIDPSLARGLSYYTGTIIEIAVKDLSGSLGGGGRYDNLVGMFLGQDVPACGFSLGLERIIVVMTERGMFPTDLVSSPADVMVTIWNEDSINESIALAHELRGAGLRVDLYPEADKVGKQFKYAAARGNRFVAVLGDDERARGEVVIKDMRSGEQRSLRRWEAAKVVRDWVR